ncbi:MAG: hypothetical protein U9R15_12620, partial [Chloroflexota bacterium]|nr:hypothetical protein [Chloroflexota bacterium]
IRFYLAKRRKRSGKNLVSLQKNRRACEKARRFLHFPNKLEPTGTSGGLCYNAIVPTFLVPSCIQNPT